MKFNRWARKSTDFFSISDVNASQPHNEVDSINNIIFKGIVSPAGTVNGSYFQYLVNQSQVEMGVSGALQRGEFTSNISRFCFLIFANIFSWEHDNFHNNHHDNDDTKATVSAAQPA